MVAATTILVRPISVPAKIVACWIRIANDDDDVDDDPKYGTNQTQSSNVVIRIVAVAPKIPANVVLSEIAVSDTAAVGFIVFVYGVHDILCNDDVCFRNTL